MTASFSDYAATSITANRLFANLDGLSFFFINFFVVIVYWVSGGRIAAGKFQIGDITAVIEYSILVMFFLMMAQMVILTLPRAFGLLGVEICQPIADVLTFFVTVPFLFPFLRQLVRMDEAEAAKV